MELSIIVPVYNTDEERLYRCFQSISKIREINYECLIIDDGSKKETGDFCRKFSTNNDKFKYIYKENGGVSSARNLGLEYAQGEWILFVDSDDKIAPENFKKYISTNYDLIFTDIEMINTKNKSHIWTAFEQSEGRVKINDILRRMTITGIINGPCGKFIKRDFIKKYNIRFDENMIIGEDAVFLLEILKKISSMYYYSESSYIYFKENETSNRRMLNHIDVYINNNITMYKQLQSVIIQKRQQVDNVEELIQLSTERYIKQLFNTAAELLLFKKMDKSVQNILIKSYQYINRKVIDDVNKTAKLRFDIIMKKRWILLYIIARFRKIYLKIRGI